MARQATLAKRLADVPASGTDTQLATTDRIIEAAERLFAELGYNGVSVRMIARAATSNLAAISYHFGDKKGLLRAIFERRVKPISDARVRALETALEEAAGGTIDLAAVIRGFVAPSIRVIRGDVGAKNFRRLAGRASTDPTPDVRHVIYQVYDAVALRYVEVLRKACRHLDDQEFYWRLNFLYGVLLYTNADTGRVQQLAGNRFAASDSEAAIDCMVQFLSAGLEAAPALGRKPRRPARSKR